MRKLLTLVIAIQFVVVIAYLATREPPRTRILPIAGGMLMITPTAAPVPTPQPTQIPTSTPWPTDTPIPWVPTSTPWPTDTPTVGTLHRATLAEWKAATVENKVLTAADWARAGLKLTDINDISSYAVELVACIDTAIDTWIQLYSDSEPITDLAVTCLILLKPTN